MADAEAIAVSANPLLEGTARSSHWRFAGRKNADGAVRAAGGQSLAYNSARLRDTVGPLEIGSAETTRAGGSLRARWVVHCVAPDAIARSEAEHAVYLRNPQAFSGELDLRLESTFDAAIDAATSLRARSLALPAIGCGIRAFPQERAGACAFRAAARWLRLDPPCADRLQRVDFVIFSDAVWNAWPTCAMEALGEPTSRHASKDVSELFAWHADQGKGRRTTG